MDDSYACEMQVLNASLTLRVLQELYSFRMEGVLTYGYARVMVRPWWRGRPAPAERRQPKQEGVQPISIYV